MRCIYEQAPASASVIVSTLFNVMESKCLNMVSYVRNPGVDFSRDREYSIPKKIFRLLVQKEGKAMPAEIAEFYGRDGMTPVVSTIYKQRCKILPSFFKDILYDFTGKYYGLLHTFHGYHLLAEDGTDLTYAANPKEEDEYVCKGDGSKPFNSKHIDALYDVLTGIYIGISTDGNKKKDEKEQGIRLFTYCTLQEVILLVDRGYESFNYMAHCIENGYKFLVRVKDVDSNGIASALNLPLTGEFDQKVTLDLTNKQTNELKQLAKEHPDKLKIISGKKFDFLPDTSSKSDPAVKYHLEFRATRIEVEKGVFVLLFTNLDPEEFPPKVLKELYHLRWKIEGAFRTDKYTLEMLNVTSKTSSLIEQEIYAKIIQHNLVHLIALLAELLIDRKKEKHFHRINITAAAGAVRDFFNGKISEDKMMAYITRNTVPIRTVRNFSVLLPLEIGG